MYTIATLAIVIDVCACTVIINIITSYIAIASYNNKFLASSRSYALCMSLPACAPVGTSHFNSIHLISYKLVYDFVVTGFRKSGHK